MSSQTMAAVTGAPGTAVADCCARLLVIAFVLLLSWRTRDVQGGGAAR